MEDKKFLVGYRKLTVALAAIVGIIILKLWGVDAGGEINDIIKVAGAFILGQSGVDITKAIRNGATAKAPTPKPKVPATRRR